MSREATLAELVERVRSIAGKFDRASFDAVLGAAGSGSTSLDKSFEIFRDKVRKPALLRKSAMQRQKWEQLKLRGIANFKRVVGDIAIEDITREHARTFYEHWLGRVSGEGGATRLTASSGNKDLDTLRALYAEYMAYVGDERRENPFRGLRFEDRLVRTRPAFSREWIQKKLLAPAALAGMNDDARRAVLALINTGARPSEIVNLTPERIVLDAPIPHIDIAETDARQLKAASTARLIPLAGVALEALREAKAAGGFARYADRDTLSAAVNKFFREHGLMETEQHTLYSLRHGFEARLKLAQVDEELRRYLMGHAISRPKYGYSEVLEWARSGILVTAL